MSDDQAAAVLTALAGPPGPDDCQLCCLPVILGEAAWPGIPWGSGALWHQDCYRAERARSVSEDGVSGAPYARTRPPRYELDRKDWAECGY